MGGVERFSPEIDTEIWGTSELQVPIMITDETGGYVRYQDYLKLKKEFKELEFRIKGLEK